MSVALIALFVALGGTSYAALKLPKNSVGSNQIKANAVASSEVKDGSLRARDFRAGDLRAGAQGMPGAQGAPGPKGDPGAPGAQGPAGSPGSALAFAHVVPNGAGSATLDAVNSKNVAVSGAGSQVCINVLDGTPQNAVASIDVAPYGGAYDAEASDAAAVVLGPVVRTIAYGCPPAADLVVETATYNGGGNARPFYVVIN